MVIGEDCLAANGKTPISKIAEERVGIAEAAEGKKRAGTDFTGGEKSDPTSEAAESKQPCRGSENRILIELPDRLKRSRRCFGASKNNQICAAHGHEWFPKSAGR